MYHLLSRAVDESSGYVSPTSNQSNIYATPHVIPITIIPRLNEKHAFLVNLIGSHPIHPPIPKEKLFKNSTW